MNVQKAIKAIEEDPKSVDKVMDELTEEISFNNGQKVHINHGILAGTDATVKEPANNGYYTVETEGGQTMPLPAVFLVAL